MVSLVASFVVSRTVAQTIVSGGAKKNLAPPSLHTYSLKPKQLCVHHARQYSRFDKSINKPN
jgi:hypothetical protein